MSYRVHRFGIRMTQDQAKLEQFLNGLEGRVVSIIPNVTPVPATFVDFLLIVEELPGAFGGDTRVLWNESQKGTG